MVSGMAQTRRKKVPSPLRKVIAGNVLARAAVQFKTSPNVALSIRTASHPTASERISVSHVRTIMKGRTSVTLEQLDALARALELQPYQLLFPRLDPENPQVAKGAAPGEDQVYGIQQIVKDATREALAEALATTSPGRRKRA